ncbi:O-phosphoseryl-tRNA(Sec) selenium transferase [Episyrphus balteatus]|uniref:O-phosphoseryl-tRNA(Sec) selenium transferase n=1 Tax=Episyrphus balteatus TaxID=286459 RepID=UPI0024857C13|nr:O-phosphoseryl-tRNA(Sec) selenium transferase [Episyrphus balteatus]
MDISSILNIEKLVPRNYLNLAIEAGRSSEQSRRILLETRKLPERGWSESAIENFIQYLSSLDSNNFNGKTGLGEREARIACRLVAKRHYNFGHGIGRSGDLLEPQPKAAGSTLMSNLTNSLLLDLIHYLGVASAKLCFLCPMATGMTLNLCLLTLKKQNPKAKYVLWSRIDQKSCFKCITMAGLQPVVIDVVNGPKGLQTNMAAFEQEIQKLGSEKILCIFSTTSCFAPRNCDNILALSQLAEKSNIPHLVNNAYGLQSTYLTHQLEQGNKSGRIDLFVQSTDKNLMVPVGGAIVAGFNEETVRAVAKTYAGRASSSQSVDVLMTLLFLGKSGYLEYRTNRLSCFEYLHSRMTEFAYKHSESMFLTKGNPISMAMTLNTFRSLDNLSKLGSMLYTRGISGVRVVTTLDVKSIDDHTFYGWGSHFSKSEVPYITVAAAIGITKSEIDVFMKKLKECWIKLSSSLK